jgi:D-3-phosphoglycerate dehydrogenase
MKEKILIADEVSDECIKILQKNGLVAEKKTKLKEQEIVSIIEPYNGIIVRSAVKVTSPIIQAGKNLKAIGRAGIGIDNIDVDAATSRGIVVMNAPSGNIIAAAEHTFALLLACARNVVRGDKMTRDGKWERGKLVGTSLENKVIGIVGLGRVGSLVAGYARAFKMKPIAYDPYVAKEKGMGIGVEMVDFETLLKNSDFITIHVALTGETKKMFGKEQFRKMKKGAIIVNTSRGGVIDEQALYEALTSGAILSAGIDVFETEPPPKEFALTKLENITLTPHLGASTREAQDNVASEIAECFVDFFRKGVARNSVNIDNIRKSAR